jgi:hypothetical protein
MGFSSTGMTLSMRFSTARHRRHHFLEPWDEGNQDAREIHPNEIKANNKALKKKNKKQIN